MPHPAKLVAQQPKQLRLENGCTNRSHAGGKASPAVMADRVLRRENMRRIVALAILVALTLGILAPGVADAQSGTPTTETTGAFGVPLGTAVPIIGTDGSPIG